MPTGSPFRIDRQFRAFIRPVAELSAWTGATQRYRCPTAALQLRPTDAGRTAAANARSAVPTTRNRRCGEVRLSPSRSTACS